MFSTDFPNESVEIFKYFSSQKKLKFSNLTILNKQTKNIYSFFMINCLTIEYMKK